MKITKFIAMAVIAMLLNACEKQQVKIDDPLDDSMMEPFYNLALELKYLVYQIPF